MGTSVVAYILVEVAELSIAHGRAQAAKDYAAEALAASRAVGRRSEAALAAAVLFAVGDRATAAHAITELDEAAPRLSARARAAVERTARLMKEQPCP